MIPHGDSLMPAPPLNPMKQEGKGTGKRMGTSVEIIYNLTNIALA